QGDEQIELLLDADAPEDPRRVERHRPLEAERPVAEEAEEPGQVRLGVGGRHLRVEAEPGSHGGGDSPANEDDQIIEGPDAERPADPEGAEVDPAEAGTLAEQEGGDQVAAEDEEDLDADPAVGPERG